MDGMEREAVTGYDWRKDAMTLVCFTTSQESHDALNRFIAHIERLEAERDALLAEREAEALFDLAAGDLCVTDALLHLYRLDRDAARDNAKRVLEGRTE